MRYTTNITTQDQVININGMTYKVVPVVPTKQAPFVIEFTETLDELDPEIFNRANEIYGNNLKYFSTLFTTEYLQQHEMTELKTCIENYYQAIRQAKLELLRDIYNTLSLSDKLNVSRCLATNCVLEAEESDYVNEQEYLDWEDDLNALSVKDHEC